MTKEQIRERAKDLCSDLFNVLTLYHRGSCTEFAEAKAVETAESIIVDIQKRLIEKSFSAFCKSKCAMGANKDLAHQCRFEGGCAAFNQYKTSLEEEVWQQK